MIPLKKRASGEDSRHDKESPWDNSTGIKRGKTAPSCEGRMS